MHKIRDRQITQGKHTRPEHRRDRAIRNDRLHGDGATGSRSTAERAAAIVIHLDAMAGSVETIMFDKGMEVPATDWSPTC